MGQRPQELLGALLAPCHNISAIAGLKWFRRRILLPIADDRVRRSLVPVATALLLTAAAENQKINHKCFASGFNPKITTENINDK